MGRRAKWSWPVNSGGGGSGGSGGFTGSESNVIVLTQDQIVTFELLPELTSTVSDSWTYDSNVALSDSPTLTLI